MNIDADGIGAARVNPARLSAGLRHNAPAARWLLPGKTFPKPAPLFPCIDGTGVENAAASPQDTAADLEPPAVALLRRFSTALPLLAGRQQHFVSAADWHAHVGRARASHAKDAARQADSDAGPAAAGLRTAQPPQNLQPLAWFDLPESCAASLDDPDIMWDTPARARPISFAGYAPVFTGGGAGRVSGRWLWPLAALILCLYFLA
jgi:hypothetical protein